MTYHTRLATLAALSTLMLASCGQRDTLQPDPYGGRYDAERAVLIGDVIGTLELIKCPESAICGGSPPQLTLDRQNVRFEPLAPGQGPDVQSLTITNTGKNNLAIRELELYEQSMDTSPEITPTGEQTRAFFDALRQGKIIYMAPESSITLDFKWTPLDEVPDTAELVIHNNDFHNTDKKVLLDHPEFAPALKLSTREVTFPRVQPTTQRSRLVYIQSTGTAALEIMRAEVSGQRHFEYTISYPNADDVNDPSRDTTQLPALISPGEELPVRIAYAPKSYASGKALLTFITNDLAAQHHTIDLTGNMGPCLDAHMIQLFNGQTEEFEEMFDFGLVPIGRRATHTLLVKNCSEHEPLEVSHISFDDPSDVFSVTLDEGTTSRRDITYPVVLEPLKTAQFGVHITAEMQARYNATLALQHNDPSRHDMVIDLSATGEHFRCPEALAEATIVGGMGRPATELSTTPRQTVQFKGINSHHPDGPIQRYEWHIVSAPIDSSARLTPSNRVENPRLFLDVAGEYEIELTVYDRIGTASCDTSAITILAVDP